MSILITGANGFIGSHLFTKLLDRREGPRSVKHEDIVRSNSYNADLLFFLSTYGNMAYQKSDGLTVKANVEDLLTVITGFYIDHWICYMSSSSVLLSIQTPYSRSKRAGEEILQALPLLKSCIVRPFTVTGVFEQKEHLIPTLIRSCMEGEPMTFDPSPTHDFIDVSDVVDALIRLADDKATGIFEFGNRIAIPNEDVRRLVEEVTGRKANITDVKPMRPYDNEDWCCKTKNDYWQPTKSLRQSITEMVAQYRHEKEI
jgi:nucleoside-diphosphate-sugar epimerase